MFKLYKICSNSLIFYRICIDFKAELENVQTEVCCEKHVPRARDNYYHVYSHVLLKIFTKVPEGNSTCDLLNLDGK